MKQTEIGMIPDDWEVKEFGKVASLINGRAYSQNELLRQGKYKVLRVGNFGTNDSWYFSDLELPEKLYCNRGDLLYCWSCTYGAYIWEEEKTIYHYHIWKVESNKSDKYFLKYILNNDTDKQMAKSNGSTMAHITKGFLEKRLFAFPPTLAEQQKIAKALSDIDNVISTLEKLITKKKNLKQGTMQQLLTGKKRLPGFAKSIKFKQTEIGEIPEDWEVVNIYKTCTIKARIGWQGLKSDEYLDTGDYVLVTGTDFDNGFINWKNCSYVSEWRYKQDKNIQIRKGDVLVTKDGTIGKIAFLNEIPMNGTLNSGVFVVRPKDQNRIDSVYLSLIFKSFWFDDFLEQITSGSTIIHLYQKDFVKFNFVLPEIKEQTAIANVLSSMDKEIEALNTKLEKYRNLKTGMMQQLLTGKIRLG